MVFPGSGFFLSFPSSYGRPRGPASPSYLHLAVLQEDLLLQYRCPPGMPGIPRSISPSKISLRALSRAGSAGAIQLLPSQRNFALYDPMPAEPRTLGAVVKGQLTFVQRDVTPYPQGQLIFVSFSKLIGFDFVKYKSFPPPEGRPRGITLSSYLRRTVLQEDHPLQLQ